MKGQTDKTRRQVIKKLEKALSLNRIGVSDSCSYIPGLGVGDQESTFSTPDPRSLIPGYVTRTQNDNPLLSASLNLIPLLEEEITKTGGIFYLARDGEEVAQYLINLAKKVNARTIIRDNSNLLQNLRLDGVLNKEGLQIIIDHCGNGPAEEAEENKAAWYQQAKEASLSITSIDYILADTGTVAIKTRSGLSRTLSLVPPIHVAIGEEWQILPGLKDLFIQQTNLRPSSAFIFITGPSRTADIEQTLTIGVHGPIEFHLILLLPK